jgi:uncharacterized protein
VTFRVRTAIVLFLILSSCSANDKEKRLTIKTASGAAHIFTVEVARTREEQARGLMFRESLAPDRGMIFPYDPPQTASFWMHNTFIPLDMVFIRKDGTIAQIAANTEPNSDLPIASGEAVAAVLEIGGGETQKRNIGEGDHVSW